MRLGLLIVAIVTALLGTLLIAVYIGRLAADVTAGREMVEVYVATRHVNRDTAADKLINRGLLKKMRIPRKYVAEGAVSSLKGLGNKVLLAPLDRGEQLTDSILSLPTSGLTTPRNMLAVAVPIEDIALINGRIKAGDRVTIFVTLEPGKDGKDVTRIVLSRVLVLAAEKSGKGQTGGQTGKASLTLAVTPGDAEKLVFSSQQGTIWAGLWPPGVKSLPSTGGQGVDSLF
ncbi:MAG: Flp pilus assembly protein CpaB [Actinomycetota bacterium]|nr:Flp pilus assembly protein CpaB [Actinomycetota bacterium]